MHPGLGLAGQGGAVLVWKRHVNVGTNPRLVFRALAVAILVFQQSNIRLNENIIDLFVIWLRHQIQQGTGSRVNPARHDAPKCKYFGHVGDGYRR